MLRRIFVFILFITLMAGQSFALGNRNAAKIKPPQQSEQLKQGGQLQQSEQLKQGGQQGGQLQQSEQLKQGGQQGSTSEKEKIEKYLTSIELNSNEEIIRLVNEMINTADSAKHKALLAYLAFNHFSNPDIMGQEEVAVYVAQNYFLNKKLEWPNSQGLFMLQTYVEFNKHSLIGMQAPPLDLLDTLRGKESLYNTSGEYTIIYFYSDDCKTCKEETPRLVDYVNEYKDGLISVYAVYTQDYLQRWKDYINKEFLIYNPFVNWVNVYDPTFESGFQMLYNVIKTPQMFVLNRDKIIIGRNMSVSSLKELLEIKNKEKDDLQLFLQRYFEPGSADTSSVYQGIDLFYERTKDNEKLFKEIFKELFLFLGSNSNYNLQQGAVYLAQKYVIEKPQLWEGSNFYEQAKKSLEIFQMNKLGSKAADLSLERPDKSSLMMYDVSKTYKVLYFYRPDCGMCSIVGPKMEALYKKYAGSGNLEFIAINLGDNYNNWIKHIAKCNAGWENVRAQGGNSQEIYSKYYIDNVPKIYLLKDNIVVAKDINDIDLEEILRSIEL